MIKNIIFDLGNVVLKLKWNLVVDRYASNDKDKQLLENVIFNSKEWEMLDEGTIEKKDAIKIMLEKLPLHLHNACLEIMTHWQESLIINTQIVDFIKQIRESGYNTYILSNAPLDIPDFLKNKDLDKYFNGKIISAEEKIIKPNKEIYQLILNRFSLNANECLFLDDKKENIDAAIKSGIHGYVFNYNNFEQFILDVKKTYNLKI